MLLTGFDAPVEQVMHLDAPLREHTLLQAIARVNRPLGEEKTYGLIVDYWGVSAKLQDALAVFSTTHIQEALTPKMDELPRLQSRHAAALKFFRMVKDTNDLEACVRVLEPKDVRAEFDLAFLPASANRSTCCCRTSAPSRITPTCAGWARFAEPRAPATGMTGSTCRAAARKCGS